MYRNSDFSAICARRASNAKGFTLRKVLKNGSLGKPTFYQAYGHERTSADVIARLESMNPNTKWVEA